MKVVLINHTFQERFTYRRWQLFAQQHPDVEVILFAPESFDWFTDKKYTFGKAQQKRGSAIDEENFHIRLFRVENKRFGGWTSPDFEPMLKQIRPDVIYHLGTHRMTSLIQVLQIRNKFLPSTKVIAFSMRGPALNLNLDWSTRNPARMAARIWIHLKEKKKLKLFNKYCDAVFCHYPDAVKCFRQEGYSGPVYMQTQVGVNTEWFHPDEEARKEIREKYGISESTYVFGSATRLTPDKGLLDILEALPSDGDWKYLMMGSGPKQSEDLILNRIQEKGLSEKVIPTGMIDKFEMAKYWNAVDCALHVPRTTKNWEETFSIALVQAMATDKPVIGSDSGSVSYQIGFDEMIVPEGNIEELSSKIKWVLSNKKDAAELGHKMYRRTVDSFSVQHLNDLFYDTLVEDVIPGNFDETKSDMVKYKN